jgi:hypothetical protein
MNGGKKIAKVLGGENIGQGVQELREGSVWSGRAREISDADFALP